MTPQKYALHPLSTKNECDCNNCLINSIQEINTLEKFLNQNFKSRPKTFGYLNRNSPVYLIIWPIFKSSISMTPINRNQMIEKDKKFKTNTIIKMG